MRLLCTVCRSQQPGSLTVYLSNRKVIFLTTRQQVRGLWSYYRQYTHTPIHTASTAALTAFGLLIFIDPLFAVLAIASYVLPPIVLYSIDADAGRVSDPEVDSNVRDVSNPEAASTHRADTETNRDADSDTDSDIDDDDSDSDGSDTDADGDDGDTDSDDSDTDSNG